VERRKETRIDAYQPVELILLGGDGRIIAANATQFSGRGLRLVVKEPVAVGTAVKIQGGDWLMLGEVCYCHHERSNYVVGLQLRHSLMGLQELEKLNRKFISDIAAPVEVPALVVLDVT
jgi:hypothetical protein